MSGREWFVFERASEGHLIVGGPDAGDYLHRMTTQDIRGLGPATCACFAITDHKGRFVAFGQIQNRGCGHYHCRLAPGAAGAAREWLERYALADDVSVQDLSGTAGLLAVCGPAAPAGLEALLGTCPPGPGTLLLDAGTGGLAVTVSPGPPLAGGCWYLETDAGDLGTLRGELAALETAPYAAGEEVWERLRIEAGVPAFGREATGKTNPWEARLDSAVSLTKGCYTGQETLNRLRTYGGVRQRIAGLALEGEEPPGEGDPVLREGMEVGRITSAAAVPGEGRSVALALIGEEHRTPGTLLECAGRPCSVTAFE